MAKKSNAEALRKELEQLQAKIARDELLDGTEAARYRILPEKIDRLDTGITYAAYQSFRVRIEKGEFEVKRYPYETVCFETWCKKNKHEKIWAISQKMPDDLTKEDIKLLPRLAVLKQKFKAERSEVEAQWHVDIKTKTANFRQEMEKLYKTDSYPLRDRIWSELTRHVHRTTDWNSIESKRNALRAYQDLVRVLRCFGAM